MLVYFYLFVPHLSLQIITAFFFSSHNRRLKKTHLKNAFSPALPCMHYSCGVRNKDFVLSMQCWLLIYSADV